MHVLSNCFLTRHLSSPFTNCPDYTPPTWSLPNAMTSSPTTLPLTSPIPATMDSFCCYNLPRPWQELLSLPRHPPPILSNLSMNGLFLFFRSQLKYFHWPLSLEAAPCEAPLLHHILIPCNAHSSYHYWTFFCLFIFIFVYFCLPY